MHVIALDDPDPPIDDFNTQLGTPAVRLGAVEWKRPKLPARGELWGTSTGLIYWPFLVDLPNGSIVPWESPSPPEHHWSVLSLWRRTEMDHTPVAEEPSWRMFPTTSAELGESFLNAPGAAFLSREKLARIQCRGRYWTIHRTVGRAVRFATISASTAWKPAWQTFLRQDAWRHLAAGW